MEIKTANNSSDKTSAFALRKEVFVCEQNVPENIEIDCEDEHATHVIAEKNGETVACARIIFSGKSAHIGRLAVKKSCRSMGVGSQICRFIIEYCKKNGCTQIWLNSQLHAVNFYEKLGFVPEGETFLEAGIEHIKMSLGFNWEVS